MYLGITNLDSAAAARRNIALIAVADVFRWRLGLASRSLHLSDIVFVVIFLSAAATWRPSTPVLYRSYKEIAPLHRSFECNCFGNVNRGHPPDDLVGGPRKPKLPTFSVRSSLILASRVSRRSRIYSQFKKTCVTIVYYFSWFILHLDV